MDIRLRSSRSRNRTGLPLTALMLASTALVGFTPAKAQELVERAGAGR
ncbi:MULTISPECIES: hypothetical protein [unclassified Mesorhizobium]|nr:MULTISPECIES: hypothetical protein [unclassified Mesorhizobium]